MAIRVPITMLGFTREQYTGVMQMLDLDATPQEGMIFHCAGQASGGWRVLGTWICRARSSTSTRRCAESTTIWLGAFRSVSKSRNANSLR
jgi:hypothetical protein